MDLNLRGHTVLITGGSQGIGLATARAFAAEGCNLHLAARTESRLQEARRDIVDRFGCRVEIHPIDISIGANSRLLAAASRDVDILVNNAGSVPGGRLSEIDELRWRNAPFVQNVARADADDPYAAIEAHAAQRSREGNKRSATADSDDVACRHDVPGGAHYVDDDATSALDHDLMHFAR
jgi:NAD(P)-dependent dehydrogenase (short-subunit alcohol dehydrogenase family)